MKTIRQIADVLGVDKQRVYRYIRKHHISEAHHEAGVMYYDEAVEMLVLQHFTVSEHISEAHHEAHQTVSSDAVISILKTELEIKNEQIRELNARLAESNAALVAAQQSAQAAQALHAGTIQRQLTEGAETQCDIAPTPGEPTTPARGFWAWLFRGNNNP